MCSAAVITTRQVLEGGTDPRVKNEATQALVHFGVVRSAAASNYARFN